MTVFYKIIKGHIFQNSLCLVFFRIITQKKRNLKPNVKICSKKYKLSHYDIVIGLKNNIMFNEHKCER